MSEQIGEKTELPTPRRLEEAWKKGQFARSAEVQTIFVVGAGVMALVFTGDETWRLMANGLSSMLAHLHDVPITHSAMQGYAISSVVTIGQCVWPVLAATTVASLLAGGIQSRFRTASEVLEADWNRVNPLPGFQRIFSIRSAVPTLLSMIKLAVIIVLTYGVVKEVLSDPIFWTPVDLARIADFMAGSSLKIILRVALALCAVAAVDYAYQFWRNQQDMMMTKEEVREEIKHSEGNPQVKSAQRSRRMAKGKRKMLAEVAQADVVVTNPTHLAVALRYDRKNMRAPKIIAKGARLNALQIREIAAAHHVPIIENKPLARFLFKHGKVGGEIPAQLYAAVAEVLAWVYRVNAYRYYREQNS